MELRVLKYYVTIVQEGNISRASHVLHISQSTLSRQIQELEEELNTTLFVRGKREIKLTEDGQLLYSRAQEILQIADDTSRTIRAGEIVSGELHVGVGENQMSAILSAVFKELLDRYPQIHVHLHNLPGDVIPHEIDRGILNFGFATSQQNLDEYYQLTFNVPDYWGILMLKDNQLAKASEIHPVDLQGQRLIISRQHGLMKNLDRWWHNAKVNPVGTYDMAESMNMMVQEGVGLAVTFDKPEYHRSEYPLVFRRFADFKPSLSKLIWRKDRRQSALEKEFISLMKVEASSWNK